MVLNDHRQSRAMVLDLVQTSTKPRHLARCVQASISIKLCHNLPRQCPVLSLASLRACRHSTLDRAGHRMDMRRHHRLTMGILAVPPCTCRAVQWEVLWEAPWAVPWVQDRVTSLHPSHAWLRLPWTHARCRWSRRRSRSQARQTHPSKKHLHTQGRPRRPSRRR